MTSGIPFCSARSPVMSTGGMVCSSQPLASAVGASILAKGGNAVDAAVAVSAVLSLIEPCSTGIGGDAFLLYYDAERKQVRGLNGSGRCPQGLSIPYLRSKGYTGDVLPDLDIHCVTVPGAAALWDDAVSKLGKLDLAQVLQPAICMCLEGVPIEPIAAHFWGANISQLLKWGETSEMLIDGKRPPQAGEIWTNPGLGRTLQLLAEGGKKGFYEGPIAEAIVETVVKHGGVMALDDLKAHETQEVNPVSCDYRGYRIHEIPPNGQGLVALIALRILSHFDFSSVPHNSAQHLHLVTEALRLAFADGLQYICDTDFKGSSVKPELYQHLLSDEYIASRVASINLDQATPQVSYGAPQHCCDTVYFSVVDQWGNAASFINSNYMFFGTGLVPAGCGFTLQNRGRGFRLNPDHPNSLQPGKRPYHTIIPSMITKDDELVYCFGVMGGWMQPQGHVQVAMNLIDYHMNPQAALDASRICLLPEALNGEVHMEDGIAVEVIQQLQARGHRAIGPVGGYRDLFGRGQVIYCCKLQNGRRVLIGGSDGRADGCAIPVII